jgi:molybdopterin-binding protein
MSGSIQRFRAGAKTSKEAPLGPTGPLHQISGEAPMRISARNRLKGKVTEVTKGATTAHVKIDVGGTMVTASVTNQAVEELGLKVGDEAYAVIKASDVMIGKD